MNQGGAYNAFMLPQSHPFLPGPPPPPLDAPSSSLLTSSEQSSLDSFWERIDDTNFDYFLNASPNVPFNVATIVPASLQQPEPLPLKLPPAPSPFLNPSMSLYPPNGSELLASNISPSQKAIELLNQLTHRNAASLEALQRSMPTAQASSQAWAQPFSPMSATTQSLYASSAATSPSILAGSSLANSFATQSTSSSTSTSPNSFVPVIAPRPVMTLSSRSAPAVASPQPVASTSRLPQTNSIVNTSSTDTTPSGGHTTPLSSETAGAPRAARMSKDSSTTSQTNAVAKRSLLTKDQKRLNHISSEKRRRSAIRDAYQDLVNEVQDGAERYGIELSSFDQVSASSEPATKKRKTNSSSGRGRGRRGEVATSGSKTVVLARAAAYIRWLEKSTSDLRDRVSASAGVSAAPVTDSGSALAAAFSTASSDSLAQSNVWLPQTSAQSTGQAASLNGIDFNFVDGFALINQQHQQRA